MWDTSNVSFELYGQLEELVYSGRGWHPLKLATRSHAMSLLCQATAEGLFDPSYVSLLVRLCLRLNCTEEASKLIGSLGAALPPPRTMVGSLLDNRHLSPLREVLDFCKSKGSSGFALHCVSTLVRDGRLPVEWILSRAFADLWVYALENMASRRWGAAAMDFAAACLPRIAMGSNAPLAAPQGGAEDKLVGPVAGMVAATLAIPVTAHDVGRERRRRRACRRVLHVLDHCLQAICLQRRRRMREHDVAFMLSLARYVVLTGSPFASATFEQQARRDLVALATRASDTKGVQSQYRQTVLLLCSLAQHRGRSCAVPGRNSVSDLCSKLESLELGPCYKRNLQKDVAFLLAQRTKDLRDLAFAESLPGSMESSWVTTTFSGWHWEEGISEWVLPSERLMDNPTAQEARPPLRQLRNRRRRNSLDQALLGAATTTPMKRRSGTVSVDKENGSEHSPEILLQGDQSKQPAKRVRTRPVPFKLLNLLPSEDDWDDLG